MGWSPTGRSTARSAVAPRRGIGSSAGLWVGTGGEGAKYWQQVLAEIKNRGTKDVCIVVSDGLTGMTEEITATWPLASPCARRTGTSSTG